MPIIMMGKRQKAAAGGLRGLDPGEASARRGGAAQGGPERGWRRGFAESGAHAPARAPPPSRSQLQPPGGRALPPLDAFLRLNSKEAAPGSQGDQRRSTELSPPGPSGLRGDPPESAAFLTPQINLSAARGVRTKTPAVPSGGAYQLQGTPGRQAACQPCWLLPSRGPLRKRKLLLEKK